MAKEPRGLTQFARQVLAHREAVLGRLVVIDPATGATSATGYAEYVDGVLTRSGVLQPPRGPLAQRLVWLWDQVRALGLTGADVCAIERLRGRMVHVHLHWASGVLLAAVGAEVVIEVPIPVWKSLVSQDPSYVKGDEADARAMGQCVVNVVRGVGTWPCPPKVPRRRAPK